ncbi:MAG: cytochrome C oxidase subunit IV family protein [Actinomycetota bacterium]|nr:cytochrome C oxidase subunit IV family protein [Actinomycetota bacterium]
MTQPTVEGVDHPAQDQEAEVEHGAHPTEAKYIKVALVLAVITAVEVGLFYTEFSEAATNAALMILAAVKFVMVVAYFMHLKFDNKLLRRLFITGFVLAASVYVAYLMTLGVFLP